MINIRLHAVSLKFILALITLLCGVGPVKAEPGKVNYAGFLKNILYTNDTLGIRLQAAEALINNNFKINVEQVFKPETIKDNTQKIDVLGVMALSYKSDSAKNDSIKQEILDHFTWSQDKQEQIIALETLARLGFSSTEKRFIGLAQTGKGEIQVLYRWILANSGNITEINELAKMLLTADSIQFRYTAQAIRSSINLSPEIYIDLKNLFNETDRNRIYRVYLVSALYVHAPEEDKNYFREDLLNYLEGEDYERYEVYEALAVKGSREDLKIINDRFEKETDNLVKVAAANAFLKNEHLLQNPVCWIDWLVIIFYGFLLIGLGWYYSYQQKNKEDYFLGGRKVRPIFSGISLYVTFFSCITVLAIIGEVIRYGPLMAIATIAVTPINYLVASYFFIPFFMKLKVFTAYELLEKPLGKEIRKIASVIFITTRILWMGLLIFLTSKAVVVIMGWEKNNILLISMILGSITVAYTTLGGIKVVVFTDLIQFFILLTGLLLTIIIATIESGGMNGMFSLSWSENWDKIDFISFNPYVRLSVLLVVIRQVSWWTFTAGSDQMAIQRFLSTKDLKSARRTYLFTQMGQALFTTVLMLVGFSILHFYNVKPNLLDSNVLVDKDFLFPHFISTQLPRGMSGLIIAALFSAAMSSLSSGVNSVSSVVTTDILPQKLVEKKKLDDLKNIRINSGLVGMIAVLVSLLIPYVPGNVVEVSNKTTGLFIIPLFNLFFMAIFVKNVKPYAALTGSFYGLFAGITIGFWDIFTGSPPLSFLWIFMISLIVTALTSLSFSIINLPIRKNNAILWGLILLLPWVLFYCIILF